jgi:selenocysteine lyase/cysteine desulfurase
VKDRIKGGEGIYMDFESIKKEFPIKKNMVYFNNASIGPMSNRVISRITDLLNDVRDYGRLHYPGWCRYADTVIKEDIAKLIGANSSEIAFVKNTTEGILIVSNGIDWKPNDNVIIADIEYPSNVYCWMNLERKGVSIKWVKNRAGRILVEDVETLMDKNTRLVSLSAVQFSNGFRLDLERLGDLCRKKKILLNLDAIQWLGALHMDLSKYHIDFLSAGGHKWLLGPMGTGIFYCNNNSMDYIHPHNVGYHSVDKSEDHMDYELTFRPDAGRFEEALVNFPGIWGLHEAIKIFLELSTEKVEKHIYELVSHAIEGLKVKGYEIMSPLGEKERSGNLSFRHPNIHSEEVYDNLIKNNINVAIRAGNLRMSPSIYNDHEEVDRFLKILG